MNNNTVSYTSISELIEELQNLKESAGDLPVCVLGSSPIFLHPLPYYYDGGFVLQDASNPINYISSRTYHAENKGTKKTENFPDGCVHLISLRPDDIHTLNGRPVRDIDPDSWDFLDDQEQEERKIFNGQIVHYKNTGVFDKELDCCPYVAYLDSGESALGKHMGEAKKNLIKMYQL